MAKSKTKTKTKPKPKPSTKTKPKTKTRAKREPKATPERSSRRWGFIDAAGALVIPPEYLAVKPFQDGVAEVKTEAGWVHIDRSGKRVPPPPSVPASASPGGPPIVPLKRIGELYGYVTADGAQAIPPRFIAAGEFRDGVAIVMPPTRLNDRHAAIDHDGNIVVPPDYERLDHSGVPGLLHGKRDGRQGVIDVSGRVVVPFEWEAVSAGPTLIGVCRDGRWGFVDHQNREVVAIQFVEVYGFTDGLAAVRVDAGDQPPVDLDEHPFRFYGVAPGNWTEGANMGHSYRLQPRAPLDAAGEKKLTAALSKAFSRGPVAFGEIQWKAGFAHLRVGEQGRSGGAKFFEKIRSALVALHAELPLAEVVYWNAQEHSRDPWDRWSRRVQPRPAAPVWNLRGFLYTI